MPLRSLSDEDFSIARAVVGFLSAIRSGTSQFLAKYTDTKSGKGAARIEALLRALVHQSRWLQSVDSTVRASCFRTRCFVQLQPWDRRRPWSGVINAGIGNDAHHYYQFSDGGLPVQQEQGASTKNGTFVYGSVEGKVQEIFQLATPMPSTILFGYRSQDIEHGRRRGVLGIISQDTPITLSGSIGHTIRRTPGYWTENYFSNHFAWIELFAKEI
ncbi:MAG: hypothetical protein ACLTZY_09520 [Alistipes indistinctus]